MAINYTNSLPLGEGIPRVTPAWADNMRLETLNAAVKLNSTMVSSQTATDPQRFWATPERAWDSDTQEVMEIALTNIRLVNHITFELPKFPHDAHLEYLDEGTQIWQPLLVAESPGEEPCNKQVLECSPPVLPPPSAVEGHSHPQHSFSGHWEPCEFLCRPTRLRRLRVVLMRHGRSRRPSNALGQLIPYSLAVRNFYCGYKVYSSDCIPRPQPVPSSATEHQDFAQTTDILGSGVSYSVRVNKAENVLRNNLDPLAPPLPSSQTLIWRSEPQPFPWAVVNYFMDVRDANGDPQVLDRFFLDPVHDGANVNLYYSNDEPASGFEAPDNPLPPQVAVINGQVTGTNPLSSDTQPYGRVTYVNVDNQQISFAPGNRWWFGGRLNWKFQRSVDLVEHPIIDCGVFHLAWTRYGMRFATIFGDSFLVDVADFQPTHDFTWMAWHDGTNAFMRIRVNGQDYAGQKALTVPLSTQATTKLRLAGFFQPTNGNSGDFKLQHMVLKMDEDVNEALIQNFMSDPTPYTVKPEFVHDDTRLTDNSILRYNPSFATNDYPTGLRGGTPTRYSAMEWSPIARDYILRRGFLYFPPTKAKYWKLEFCGLTPEPYEVYVPVKRKVKTYLTEMWMAPAQRRDTMEDWLASLIPGLQVQMGVQASFQYSDSLNVSTDWNNTAEVKGWTNTTVRVVTNFAAQIALSAVSWAWNFLPFHKPTYVPQFEKKCVHEYEEIHVEQMTKMSFFVGLKGIAAYRVSYLALEDTSQYVELFHDKANIDPDSGWVLEQDHSLNSGDTRFTQTSSRVFPSNRIVRAMQFATTQSAPKQLLPDDDFDDSSHANWRSVGDGALAPFTSTVQAVGSVLRIDRSSRAPSWRSLETGVFNVWHAFEDQAATWAQVEQSGNPAQGFGGVESLPVSTPPGGRIYAAARVIAPQTLQNPLYVQIIDDATGAVLSEAPSDIQANQITEWYTSYTIGDTGDVLAWRWRDFFSSPTYQTFVDNFARANATSLGNMLSNQAWVNTGQSHSIVTNQAKTVVAGSFDFVNGLTPWGSFEMVVGTIGTGAAAPLFDLLPFKVDDAGLLTYTGGRWAAPATSIIDRAVAANDDIRIDVLPTVLVPSNLKDTAYTDSVSAPYSLVIYLNGTWIKTIAHRMGARTRCGFQGRLNQIFKNFSWLPIGYGQLPGPMMWALPVTGNGSFDAVRLSWTDIDSNLWSATGTVDNANATTPGVLIFTSAKAEMSVNTRYWYGTLTAGVRHVADGTMGRHGRVMVLDADRKIYLRHDGNIIQVLNPGTPIESEVSYGNIIPGGISNGSVVQIQFLDTVSVASSIRGSIDPAVYPRMLVARVAGNVVGTYASAALQGWTGTRRGLAGDLYDGTPGATIADNHTSFDSFGWAPDASNTVLDPKNPTWNEISQRGTGTWDSVSHYLTLTPGRLKARVVQRNPSIDVWDIDTLSMFADSIVWSFSNDGGVTFWNAFDVKNNPTGVLVFPEGYVATTVPGQAASGSNPGQALIWRVISYAPNSRVSSLVIRPWYGGLLSGITHRTGVSGGGPNVMPYDHYPPIEQDSRFQTWHLPIPQDWWYQYRILARSKDEVLPPPKLLLLPEAITSKYKGEA